MALQVRTATLQILMALECRINTVCAIQLNVPSFSLIGYSSPQMGMQYGSNPSQYGSMSFPSQYGANQYGSNPSQYGSMSFPSQYGANQYGSMSNPSQYGSMTNPYGSSPYGAQYSSMPASSQYNSPMMSSSQYGIQNRPIYSVTPEALGMPAMKRTYTPKELFKDKKRFEL
jgi:hypothetical protein